MSRKNGALKNCRGMTVLVGVDKREKLVTLELPRPGRCP